jgi:diguanylate cyclase (GGDEF)-like protein
MRFDPPSIALIAWLVCLAFGSSLIALSRHHSPARALPLEIWSRALILAPLGWLVLELSRHYGPMWLAVPGKTLIMAGFVEFWRALRAFSGRPTSLASLIVPVAFVALASVAWLLLRPGEPMSTRTLLMLSAGYAIAAGLVALRLAQPTHLMQALLVAVTMFGAGLLLGLRVVLKIIEPWVPSLAWIGAPESHSLLLGTALMLPALATLGFVLLDSERNLDELKRLADLDGLTGLLNRTAFLREGGQRLAAAKASGSACALLMLDVDHFKRVNDSFGHETGDRALCLVAETIAAALPSGGLASRCGGEEFVVLIPGCDAKGAAIYAERIRLAVKQRSLMVNGIALELSVSIGVAELSDSSDDLSLLMRRADHAMYRAKGSGRDQVRLHLVG